MVRCVALSYLSYLPHSLSRATEPRAIYPSLAVIVAFCFGHSLYGDFVFDDSEAIVSNEDLNPSGPQGHIRSLLSLFEHDFWGNRLTDQSSHKSYRPLTVLAYWLIARAGSGASSGHAGGLNSVHFHATNLAGYYLLCSLLYLVLCSFLASDLVALSKQRARNTAALVTLLFASHPVHCEPVVSCVGLADILSALCCVIAFGSYVRNVDLRRRVDSQVTLHQLLVESQVWSTIATFFVGCALFFKEPGITFLGIFIILDCVLLLAPYDKRSTNSRIATGVELVFFLCAAFSLLYLRLWVMDWRRPEFSAMDNPASHVASPLYRHLNYAYVYLLNVFIAICPIWLCFDWSMGCIPLIESLLDIRVSILATSVMILALVLCRLLSTCRCNHQRSLLIFVLFSVLPFLPSSNLFFPVGFVIAERNLFVPILGYLLIFVTAYQDCLQSLSLSPLRKLGLQFGFGILLLTNCGRSFSRTKEWTHERDLFQKDAAVCPGNAKIFYNIGKIAADEGNVEKAMLNYEQAILLHENYTNALNNYANILKDRGQLLRAKTLLERACGLDPKFAAAFMNLAIVEMSLHQHSQAEAHFRRAIELRPKHANSHFNLGNLYLQMEMFAAAEQAFHRAVELDSGLVRAWNNLIVLQQKSKQLDQALELAERAISLNGAVDSLHFLAGSILGEQNKLRQSEEHFERAIALRPTASYHYNLAVLYHRNQMYDQASRHYSLTLSLNQQHQGATKQLQALRHQAKTSI